MSDPKPQGGGGQPQSGGNSGGGGGNQPQKKPQQRGAPAMDIIRYAAWGFSAFLTAIGVLTFLATVPPTCRDAVGALTSECMVSTALSRQGLYILIGAFVLQVVISMGTSRFMRHAGWALTFRIIEVLLNLIGFYWLICLWFGYFPGVAAIVRGMTKETAAGFIVISVLAYYWDELVDAFGAAPSAPQQGGKK